MREVSLKKRAPHQHLHFSTFHHLLLTWRFLFTISPLFHIHSRETAAARYGYPPPQHPPPHYGYGAPPGGVKRHRCCIARISVDICFRERNWIQVWCTNGPLWAHRSISYQILSWCFGEDSSCLSQVVLDIIQQTTASQTAGHPPPPGYGYGPCDP